MDDEGSGQGGMTGELHPWVRVAEVGAGWEADLTVARLEAEEVPARASGNDLVGIFGPGFQGASHRGFFVEVPAPLAERARWILSLPVPQPDESELAEGEPDDFEPEDGEPE